MRSAPMKPSCRAALAAAAAAVGSTPAMRSARASSTSPSALWGATSPRSKAMDSCSLRAASSSSCRERAKSCGVGGVKGVECGMWVRRLLLWWVVVGPGRGGGSCELAEAETEHCAAMGTRGVGEAPRPVPLPQKVWLPRLLRQPRLAPLPHAPAGLTCACRAMPSSAAPQLCSSPGRSSPFSLLDSSQARLYASRAWPYSGPAAAAPGPPRSAHRSACCTSTSARLDQVCMGQGVGRTGWAVDSWPVEQGLMKGGGMGAVWASRGSRAQ